MPSEFIVQQTEHQMSETEHSALNQLEFPCGLIIAYIVELLLEIADGQFLKDGAEISPVGSHGVAGQIVYPDDGGVKEPAERLVPSL